MLHRKRPQFIYLYDPQVGHVYGVEGTPPVPRVKGRSWGDFVALYAAALRRDLQADPTFWHDLGALGAAGPVTALRALDIVAWSISDYRRGRSSAGAPTSAG